MSVTLMMVSSKHAIISGTSYQYFSSSIYCNANWIPIFWSFSNYDRRGLEDDEELLQRDFDDEELWGREYDDDFLVERDVFDDLD